MIRIDQHFFRRVGGHAACALVLAAPLAWSQEAAVTKRATELRQAPSPTAPTLAALPEQTPLTRLPESKLPWVQVRTAAGVTGWVHLFDVGPAAGGGARVDPGGSANPLRFLSRSANTNTATSASGVRGVTAEEIKNAQPDTAAVGRMEALRQSEADARAFAGGATLRAVAVDPLPAPARASSPAGGSTNPQSQ